MPKNPNKLFPLFVTKDLDGTKRFYAEAGFDLVFDLPTYVQVRYGSDPEGPELCFMTPDSFPDGKPRPPFEGAGVIVSIPTENADALHAHLAAKHVELASSPTDKPWGWRSFFAVDPNGLLLDFFHVTAENMTADAAG